MVRSNLAMAMQGFVVVPLFAGFDVRRDRSQVRRTISLTGASLPLTDSTAQALNETFAKPQGKTNVFQSGEALGTLSFTVAAE